MTMTEAINIVTKDFDQRRGNDTKTTAYNNDAIQAYNMIIEAAKKYERLRRYSKSHTFCDVLDLIMKEDKRRYCQRKEGAGI